MFDDGVHKIEAKMEEAHGRQNPSHSLKLVSAQGPCRLHCLDPLHRHIVSYVYEETLLPLRIVPVNIELISMDIRYDIDVAFFQSFIKGEEIIHHRPVGRRLWGSSIQLGKIVFSREWIFSS
jgi:hypothetical protein